MKGAQLADASPTEQEELKQRTELELEKLRRLAPSSLEAHGRYVHRDDHNKPLVAAPHHAEWIELLEARERFPWLVVVAPPGFAKSTWHSWVYPTWRQGQAEGRLRIGLVSRAAGQAGAWVAAVGESVESARFAAAYPAASCRPNKKRGWSRSEFYLEGTPAGNNPALLASGIGGVSVLGKRFDEILLDDPTTWEDARSKTKMEGQKHFLRTTLISRFPPGMGPPDGEGGRMATVLTRWTASDLVPELESLGFTVVRMPALGYPDRVVQCDECGYQGEVQGHAEASPGCPKWPQTMEVIEYGERSLWEERISESQLLKLQEEDPLVFALVYLGDTQAFAGDFFDPEWFQHRVMPDRTQFERVVTFVDTASGKKREEGDYTVALTLGKLKGGRDEFFVMGVERGRFSTVDQPDLVRRVARQHSPDLIAIEDKNEGVALFQALAKADNLPIRPYTPVKDKEYRATPVAAKYRVGRVFHEGEERSGVMTSPRYVRNLELEMTAFPDTEHDDQVDALAGAFNCMVRSGPRLRVLGLPGR